MPDRYPSIYSHGYYSRLRTVCDIRGFCGPFANQKKYDQFPDSGWHGLGECVLCGSTVNVRAHEEMRRRASRDQEAAAAAPPPPKPPLPAADCP